MSRTRSFAAYNKDTDIRVLSSSGGVFYVLARRTILEEGVVFGAAFDEEGMVRHQVCETIEELPIIMQSKYVQSAMNETYRQVLVALKDNRKVLFCGTPCQVYGLISYLNLSLNGENWRERLVTIDFICHGVPSPLVWKRYLKEISGGRKATAINFRDKTNGWRDFSLKINFNDGTQYLESQKKDPYMRGFLENLYLRESCHECRFRGIERESDFTIADFWGVHEFLPDFFDDKGTSIVMTHNDRAVQLLNEVSDSLVICEIDSSIVKKTNSPIVRSVSVNARRDEFMKTMSTKSISGTLKKYTSISFINRIKQRINRIIH